LQASGKPRGIPLEVDDYRPTEETVKDNLNGIVTEKRKIDERFEDGMSDVIPKANLLIARVPIMPWRA
jgi:hypothetical protein